GDHLEVMAARVVPVHASSAVVAVDLERALVRGIRPIREPARTDALEDRVELRLADQECVVLDRYGFVGILEVERHAVVDGYDPKGAEASGLVAAQDLGEEFRRGLCVAGRDDRVIELDGHQASPAGPARFEWSGRGARPPTTDAG